MPRKCKGCDMGECYILCCCGPAGGDPANLCCCGPASGDPVPKHAIIVCYLVAYCSECVFASCSLINRCIGLMLCLGAPTLGLRDVRSSRVQGDPGPHDGRRARTAGALLFGPAMSSWACCSQRHPRSSAQDEHRGSRVAEPFCVVPQCGVERAAHPPLSSGRW